MEGATSNRPDAPVIKGAAEVELASQLDAGPHLKVCVKSLSYSSEAGKHNRKNIVREKKLFWNTF